MIGEARTIIIAVVGSKKSGKTTAIEALTRVLTKRGYRVAAVKHVSEEDFSIDTEGKDTWRFAQAGARTIVAVSSNEIATIERGSTEGISLKRILQKCRGNHVVLLEGFRKSVTVNKGIFKIVTVKSAEEALEASSSIASILAFVGPFSTKNLNLKAHYVDALEDPEGLADIVEDALKKKC
jgi:molybdopterin-guanine dinucleotide biosynthesis protein B